MSAGPDARDAPPAQPGSDGASDPYRAAPPPAPRPRARSYLEIVTSTPVLLMSLAACAGSFAVNGLNSFLPLYLAKERGVGDARAGVLTGAFFALTLVGQLSGGLVSDGLAARMRGARPLLVSLPYLAAAPAAVAMVGVPTTMLALACYGATQVARGFAEPNIYGTIIDGTSADERGTAQGFLLLLTFLGSSLAPFLAGVVIERRGFTPAIELLAAGAAVSGAFAGALSALARRSAA